MFLFKYDIEHDLEPAIINTFYVKTYQTSVWERTKIIFQKNLTSVIYVATYLLLRPHYIIVNWLMLACY